MYHKFCNVLQSFSSSISSLSRCCQTPSPAVKKLFSSLRFKKRPATNQTMCIFREHGMYYSHATFPYKSYPAMNDNCLCRVTYIYFNILSGLAYLVLNGSYMSWPALKTFLNYQRSLWRKSLALWHCFPDDGNSHRQQMAFFCMRSFFSERLFWWIAIIIQDWK